MLRYAAVIPAHNEADYIAGAIESVLAQSLPAEEIIVVDDGSVDGTNEVAGRFPGVDVLRHAQCLGPSQARNTGFRRTSCEWIAFLDADDRWYPEKVERQAEVGHATGAGLVYCGTRVVWQDSPKTLEIKAASFRRHRNLCRGLLTYNCITGSGSGVLVRRDLLEKVGGFDTNLAVSEDWDMWLRLSQITRFAAVRRPLVTLTKRSNSLGSDAERMFQGAHAVLTKNAALFSRFWDGSLLWRKAEAKTFRRRGIRYLLDRQPERAKRDLWRSLSIWPFSADSIVPLSKLYLGME